MLTSTLKNDDAKFIFSIVSLQNKRYGGLPANLPVPNGTFGREGTPARQLRSDGLGKKNSATTTVGN
ncbi:MAG: hypothetical protein V3V70_05560 [Candidatus Scalindua sp.]